MEEHAGKFSKAPVRLASLRVSLTGFDAKTREKISAEIALRGGVVTPRLDLSVDVLIVPNRDALTAVERSAKVEFATKHGISILPVQEVLELGTSETLEAADTAVVAKHVADPAPIVPQCGDGGCAAVPVASSNSAASVASALQELVHSLQDATVIVALVLGSQEQRDLLFRWSSLAASCAFFVQPCITRQTTHVVIGSLVNRSCQRTVAVLEEFLKVSTNIQRQNVMAFSWLETLFGGCDDEFSDWDLQQRFVAVNHEQYTFFANAVTRSIAVQLQSTLEPAPTVRPLAKNVPSRHAPPASTDGCHRISPTHADRNRLVAVDSEKSVEAAILDAQVPSRTTEDSVWDALAALCSEGGIAVGDTACIRSGSGIPCDGSSTERTLRLLNAIFCGSTPENNASLAGLFRGTTFLCEELEKSLPAQGDVFDRDRIAALRLLIKCGGGTLLRKRPSEIATMVAEKDPVLRARRVLDLPCDDKAEEEQHHQSPRVLYTVALLPHAFERCATQVPQQRRFRLEVGSSLRGTKNKRRREDDQREAFPSVDSLRLPQVTSTWIVASVLSRRRLRFDDVKRRPYCSSSSTGCVMTHLRCHACAFTGIPIECFGHGAASMRKLVDGLALPIAPSVFLLERRYLKHSLHHEMLLALNPATIVTPTVADASATGLHAPSTLSSTDVGHGVHILLVTEVPSDAGTNSDRPLMTAVDTTHMERAVVALGGVLEGVYCGVTSTLPPPAVLARVTHVVTDRSVSTTAEQNTAEAQFIIDSDRCSVEVADLLRWVARMAASRQDIVIVDASWLTTSFQYGYFVEEAAFEIRGGTNEGRGNNAVALQRKAAEGTVPAAAAERAKQAAGVPRCGRDGVAPEANAVGDDDPSHPKPRDAAVISADVLTARDHTHAKSSDDDEGEVGEADKQVDADALAASVAFLERSVGEGNGSAVKRPRNVPPQGAVKVEPSSKPPAARVLSDTVSADAVVGGAIARGDGGEQNGAESPTAVHRLCPLVVGVSAADVACVREAVPAAAIVGPDPALPHPQPAPKGCARVYVLSSHPELANLKRLVLMFATERPCLAADSTAHHRSQARWTCFSWALSPSAADIVVTNEVTQRESVLLAIAAGAWLVSSQYFVACVREQRVCDVEPYEWTEHVLSGEQAKKRSCVLLARHCRFWRMLKADRGQGPMGAPCIHQVILFGCPHEDILSSIVAAGAGVCRTIPIVAMEHNEHQGQSADDASRALDVGLRQLEEVLASLTSSSAPRCRRGSLVVILVSPTLLASSQVEICQRVESCCRGQRLHWGLAATTASPLAVHPSGETDVVGADVPCHYACHVIDATASRAERTDMLRVEVHQPEWLSLTLQRRAEKLTPVFLDYM